MLRKTILACVLSIVMAVSSSLPAYAWKANTHVYSANLILEDLKDEYLEINGMGKYKVPDDIYKAVTKYPAAYRAGTLGPDIYPDIATGLGNIHQITNKADAGKYLQLMIDAYHKVAENNPQREKIYAYILGFATHYAGDIFGHSFVNDWAKGALTGNTANYPDKVNIALRHVVVEGYVDSKAPEDQRTGSNISLDAPIEFIKEILIDEASAKYNVSSFLEPITSLRDALEIKAETLKIYKGGDLSLEQINQRGVSTGLAGYAEKWLEFIDNGLLEWITANQKMAQAMLDKDKNSSDVIEPMSNWVEKYGAVMAANPDALAGTLGIPADAVPLLLNLMTSSELKKKMKESDKYSVYRAIEEAAGLSINEYISAIKDPLRLLNSSLFDSGKQTSGLIDQQLKNFGIVDRSSIGFDPFYNTVQMGKLILIGYDNLYRVFPHSKYESQDMADSFDKIDVTIKTGNNSTNLSEIEKKSDNAFRETDDDIFFILKLKNGKTYEKLLDRPGYNDFESNKTETYTLALPVYITFGDIASVGIRKGNIITDNWYPDWIVIKARNSKIIHESGFTKGEKSFYKVFAGNDSWTWDVSMEDIMLEDSSFDPAFINFIKNLDDSEQWMNSNMYLSDKDSFDKVFRGYANSYKVNVVDTGAPSISFDGASNWAIPELQEAYDLNLFTDKVKGNYKANVTRAEFAGLAVNLYEALAKSKAAEADRNTFTDTNDSDVLKAYRLKIVGGMGDGTFAPDSLITREQIAVMYYNTIKAVFEKSGLVMPVTDGILTVEDKDLVSGWAAVQVDFVFDQDIIKGDGVSFDPKGNASREAAIAVVKRVYKKYFNY